MRNRASKTNPISGRRPRDASHCEMMRLGRVTPSAGRDAIDRKACFLSLLAQAAVHASVPGPACDLETCPRQFQGLFFLFFAGMPAAYFRSMIADPLDTTQRAESAAAQAHFTFGDCVPLRADL